MTNRSEMLPDWISPPGDTIEDLLEERGWTRVEFAQRTAFTPKHINELLKGRAPISADTAAKLARVLGSTPEFWLVREARYRAALERQRSLESPREESDWLKELPLSWMRAHGWVQSFSDKSQQIEACMRYFGVASVGAWRDQYENPLTAFRASQKYAKRLGPVAAWLRRGELLATNLECKSYDESAFKAELSGFRALTQEHDLGVIRATLTARCAERGVAVVFVPAPPGCPASGATRWLTPEKALLLLSLRYKTNDHLWFTFFHEAGHLLKHRKKGLFVDGLNGLDGEQEKEADRFACDLLIPPSDARRLEALAREARGRLSKEQVQEFARGIGVAPGVVVGRMQKEGWVPWSHFKDLKDHYDWHENVPTSESEG